MILCGWRSGGRRECLEPGEILVQEGPRWLCRSHVATLERLREDARRRRARWLGFEETSVERADRISGRG